ncbi:MULTISPECIES: hypothetical protein [Enterococcus]|uniref:Uncharacterized protein n=1 Tax=Candidatus Enterococcus murrayae TaxID=2815321 RepID=A0ABS3HJV5_9ENTE|nr:hypothetical protein [Enterococcus sp. MJM16]MBO0453747.1 hypothetical protein [Enterococcus sp. MJM16]
MQLNNGEAGLLANPRGTCKLNDELDYIFYMKTNWEAVKEFCAPFSIEKSKMGIRKGRAVIDLPSGNEAFNYGTVLVRLGNKRILLFSSSEFLELFSYIGNKD